MAFLGGAVADLGGGSIGAAVVKLILDNSEYEAGLAGAESSTAAAAAGMAADAEVVSTSWGVAAGDMVAANEAAAAGAATSWGVATAEIEADSLLIEEAAAKMSTAVVAAYAAAGLAAALFAKASIEAALALENAENKLGNSIANSTKVSATQTSAFVDQANAISRLTGVHNDQIIASQSLQVQMGLTADQVKALTPLIVDLSVKQGVDLNTATKAVGKAVNGNSGALGRLGVVIDKTAFKTDHYGTVLKGLGAAQGYAASAATIEPWKKLGNELHDVEETVGKGLVPELQHLATNLDAIANHHLPDAHSALGTFQFAMGAAFPAIHAFGINLGDAGANVTGFKAGLDQLQAGLNDGSVSAQEAAGKVRDLALANGYTAAQTDQLVASTQGLMAQQIRQSVAADKSTRADERLAIAHHKAAVAANLQRQAEEALANQALGLIGSLENLRTDQETLNKLRDKGKQGTEAYNTAVEQQLNDQISVNAAFKTYVAGLTAAQQHNMTFQGVLSGVAHQAGVTKGDLAGMLSALDTGGKQGITTLQQLRNEINRLTAVKHIVPVDVQIAGVVGTADMATQIRAIIVRELARSSNQ